MDLAKDTKGFFDSLMRGNEENGLTLMFNAQKQVELNPPPFKIERGWPITKGIIDFGEQGFSVCAWDDSIDLTPFPEELREKMEKGPFILVNYKWVRELEREFIVIGPQKGPFKEMFLPRAHWDKSTSLPGHFFISLPKDIYRATDFLKYVWG